MASAEYFCETQLELLISSIFPRLFVVTMVTSPWHLSPSYDVLDHTNLQTSQKLRRLSSVTINCQVTKVVMNSLYQMSKFSRIFFSSVYMTNTFVWIVKVLVNCLKLSIYVKCQNFGNACNFQYFSKLSKNVKMVNNCRKLYWLFKMVQIVNNVEYYPNWPNCQKYFKLSKHSKFVINFHHSQKTR